MVTGPVGLPADALAAFLAAPSREPGRVLRDLTGLP